MRVLVVEDEFVIAMELEAILTAAGARVCASCSTVEEALAACDADGVTAAILDIRLGSETTAPVARALAERGVPFIFYSGQIENDPVRSEWPGCRILAKPARARDPRRGRRSVRASPRRGSTRVVARRDRHAAAGRVNPRAAM